MPFALWAGSRNRPHLPSLPALRRAQGTPLDPHIAPFVSKAVVRQLSGSANGDAPTLVVQAEQTAETWARATCAPPPFILPRAMELKPDPTHLSPDAADHVGRLLAQTGLAAAVEAMSNLEDVR